MGQLPCRPAAAGRHCSTAAAPQGGPQPPGVAAPALLLLVGLLAGCRARPGCSTSLPVDGMGGCSGPELRALTRGMGAAAPLLRAASGAAPACWWPGAGAGAHGSGCTGTYGRVRAAS